MRWEAPRKRRTARSSCIRGTFQKNGTKAGRRRLLELVTTAEKSRGLETNQGSGRSLRVITTAIQGLVRPGALRQIPVVCMTWVATYGNGAKIGTVVKCKTLSCA